MNKSTLHRSNFLLHLQERSGYDQSVLIKEPAHKQLSRSDLDQLHNEYSVTKQLSEVTGVRQAYAMEGSQSHPVLLLEYIPGQSLAELIRAASLDMTEKLSLAVNLATVLNLIHEQQVMHKDINSSNILLADNDMAGSQNGVYIIGFGLASNMLQESPSPLALDGTLVGTLAYISPEQTGRMNRQVDYRTDLYSLGVTLYELFTGRLPFVSGDAMETIHAHIAREPQPPHQVDTDIPETVSDIILKLLAKNAEDRYQTTRGLQIDLQHCLDQYQATGQIEMLELGTDDFTGHLQIPQKLYGRDTEIEQLKAVHDRAVSGSAQLLLIAGYSGVGKTALVHEIKKDVIAKQSIFIEGKFDQLQRTLPYSAWAQAFTQLVNTWLTESTTTLEGWRQTILEAIGDQGQILIDIIPALEQIIGQQPEVAQLGGIESQNRFNYIFNRLINALATQEHPLVIFLDDLQWIDPASLNLIESLLTVQSANRFLIIGAYRNNEVGPDHPLSVSHEKMLSESQPVTTIVLEGLAHDDTNQMLADTLQLSVADCRELSKALADKTAGNPFYLRQQLYELESDEALSFEFDRKRWVWREKLQESLQTGGNVVDLMVRKIRTLPVESQHTLSMAACLGSRFKETTLHTVTGRSQEDVLSDLKPALKSGLILKSHKHFSFAHDRIQEAGYSLTTKADLAKTHLEIGRLLLANTTDEDVSEEVFDVVRHLNAGRDLIEPESEKLELVNLNFKAGQKAKAASAFSDARKYIDTALDLLESESWQRNYELTLSLYNEMGELNFYIGQYDQVKPVADVIHANARSIIDLIRIYKVQMEVATSLFDFGLTITIGLDALEKLGLKIPSRPGPENYRRLYERYLELLDGRPDEVIFGLPRMTDDKALSASTIMIGMLTASYITRPDLYAYLGLTGGIFTLEHGVFPWSPHFFAQFGSALWVANNLDAPSDQLLPALLLIRQMQEVVLNMVKDPFFKPCQAKGLEGVGQVGGFCRPMEENTELARKTLVSGFEVGDMLFAAHGPVFVALNAFVAGMNLDELRNELLENIHVLESAGHALFATFAKPSLQAVVNFIESKEEPQRLTGRYFDEDAYLSAAEDAGDYSGVHNFYAVRLRTTYHFDVDQELVGLIDKAESLIFASPGQITIAVTRVYAALSRIRLYPTFTPEDQTDALNQVDQTLRLVDIWTQSVPGTFKHLYSLIGAEKARVTGDIDKALDFYEQAIQGAHAEGFTNDEALANELYARFWAERDNDRFASQFMREAHSLYQKWGAHAKAKHLEKRYPNWLIGHDIGVDQRGTQTIPAGVASDVDLHTVLKASQEIASEIALESLLAKLMEVIIENAGAQQGFLILKKGGRWFIEAEGDTASSKISVLQSQDIELNDAVSSGIVNYVARTQDNVILGNAANEGDFTRDESIQQNQAKSVLCTPFINQGKVSGIMYLENKLVKGAFTSERVELLNLLSSQMAMALDNAQLYANLEERVEQRTEELIEAKEEAEAANKSKSTFLASVSHELRTPLNAILGFSNMVGRDHNAPASVRDKVSIINRSGEHLLGMIDDVLDLSKIEAGRAVLEPKCFDLRLMLQDIANMFEARASSFQLRFNLKLDDLLARYIKTDPGKLRQILMNLLGNALNFTTEGGVSLHARTVPIDDDPTMVMLQLEIQDSGQGIAPEQLERIFEPYVQAEHSKSDIKGTGLGLAISKSCVDLLGGEISVKSTPGVGSLFRADLPVALAKETDVGTDNAVSREVIGLESGQAAWRILIIEDNAENRKLLTDMLQQVGFEVREAENGKEGVAQFEQWQPHFIWMDMRMPVMDGCQAAARIRQLPGGESIKIVAVTASTFRELHKKILESGCNDVVHKPTRANEIFDSMQKHLGVRYIYEEEASAAAEPPIDMEQASRMAAVLPDKLLHDLEDAFTQLDIEASYHLLEQVDRAQPELADMIRKRLDEMDFTTLQKVLERE